MAKSAALVTLIKKCHYFYRLHRKKNEKGLKISADASQIRLKLHAILDQLTDTSLISKAFQSVHIDLSWRLLNTRLKVQYV